MSTKMKTFISALLALIVAAFSWYVAYSDGDPTTNGNTDAVMNAGTTVITTGIDAFSDDEETTATESTTTETADTTAATEATTTTDAAAAAPPTATD